ncbi:MAG: hypothetical protein ABIP90_10935, partial [Vicinamibacterales bacterium]
MQSASAGFAPVAILVVALGTIAWMMFWLRHLRRQGRALWDRIESLERRLAGNPVAAGEAARAQAPDSGLPVGAPLSALAATLSSGRPMLILFVSSGCPGCTA